MSAIHQKHLAHSNNRMNRKHSYINEEKYQSEKLVQLFLIIRYAELFDCFFSYYSILCLTW